MRFNVVFPGLMALASAGFLLLAFRGLAGRRPLVFRSRRMLVPIVLCLLPGSLAPYLAGASAGRGAVPIPLPLLLLPLAVDAGVLALVLYALRGYMVLGAGDRALVDALKAALGRLGMPFEESLGSLRLSTIGASGAHLKLLQQGATGSAQLRMEPEDGPLLDRIAAALREALAAAAGTAPFRGLVFGVFAFAGLVLLGIGLAFLP